MLYPLDWKSYELIDVGEGRKLERFGELIVDRPEPLAKEKKSDLDLWKRAEAMFYEEKGQKGNWDSTIHPIKINYQMENTTLAFHLKQTSFKHLGIFPEQAVNWQFIADYCARFKKHNTRPNILNLFAYTGAASIVSSVRGASVSHIDSSKSVVSWARENAQLNNASTIRWMVEDARKFVEKSIKRKQKFQGVILDPPIFGMVPKGKNWKLNTDLKPLLEDILKILDPDTHFLVLNTYSPQLPLKKLIQLVSSISEFPNKFEVATLGLKSTTGKELELGNLIRFNVG